MLAAEDLQRLGDALWTVRWNAIVYLDPANNSQLTIVKLATDMNADGAITVSDANLWLKWLSWLPGDYVFIALMKWAPSIAYFFELGYTRKRALEDSKTAPQKRGGKHLGGNATRRASSQMEGLALWRLSRVLAGKWG